MSAVLEYPAVHDERHRAYNALVPSVQVTNESLKAKAIRECMDRGHLAPLLCTRVEDVDNVFREFAAKCLEYDRLSIRSSLPDDLLRLTDAIHLLTPYVATGAPGDPPAPNAGGEAGGGARGKGGAPKLSGSDPDHEWPHKCVRPLTLATIIKGNKQESEALKHSWDGRRTFYPKPRWHCNLHSQALVYLVRELVDAALGTEDIVGADLAKIRAAIDKMDDELAEA